MFRVTVLDQHPGTVTLALSGSISKDALAEIEHLLACRCKQDRVLLDFSEVTLLDPAAARFFSRRLGHGVELVNCPHYISHWISPQIAHEPNT